MAKGLSGVRGVKRIETPGKPSIFLFQLDRGQHSPSFVIRERRDEFTREDMPAVPFDWAWATGKATALDALGQVVPVQIADGRLHLSVSLTPVFVEPAD